ncbi:thrombospondin type 3 repeat-containing protein [Coraliomargarita sp. SDUM461004]|uniref:Thrombospondin type 3 repeat-containing protein n=1 Tax=Thalassobacterium sedimentorum TaxID=3041258 RepID=A0ABU1ALC6_9BACT|nr:thrombospondin type 3 repeat-containing protein [Coraliomargarita sp. SDUM461004]MDQ8195003.1 thrombospondin type 3 repeat-containing protein [Coraliomargarita sp. SDUM461004]
MKELYLIFALLVYVAVPSGYADALVFDFPPDYPYPGAVGTETTTAVSKDDVSIVAWATGVYDYSPGTNVDAVWQDSTKGLGAAQGTSYEIVCLGRGGSITLEFQQPIMDGSGADFAVFENSFSDSFLELAWVEISSDGVHFVRFPNFSQTPSAVGGFGIVDANKVHGFAGKYRAGYGTPFDLAEIKAAYTTAVNDDSIFPISYSDALVANYEFVDFNQIQYVRIVDVVGDGSQVSALRDPSTGAGFVLYDPFPTVGSAGFDLDAVAVFNQVDPAGLVQSIDFPEIANQRLAKGTLELAATASSGLPVVYTVVSGNATLAGSILTMTGLGPVVVKAEQSGDATYAAATPVSRAFTVADELQHIYMMPLANQLVGALNVQVNAYASSGMPVRLYIDDGPENSLVTEWTHLFSSGSEVGTVTLRASQTGGESAGVTYAPATDVSIRFEVVNDGDRLAALDFVEWQALHNLVGDGSSDSDRDGASDLAEYAAGTDPNRADSVRRNGFEIDASGESYLLTVQVDRRALIELKVETNTELSNTTAWQNVIPELMSSIDLPSEDGAVQELRLRVPILESEQQFWRYNITPANP